MTIFSRCPEPVRIKALVHGDLPVAEQSKLADHLAACHGCRSTFEALAAAPDVLGDAARDRGRDRRREPFDERLRQVMDDLKSDPLAAAATKIDSPSLDDHAAVLEELLEPSDDPAFIGRIGDYDVIELIGRGGMGLAMKARDARLNRIVAVKVLAPEWASNATARRRFLREAQAAAAVSHDHVVTTHAVDDGDRLPYIVMEYVPGLSLEEKLNRDGALEVKEILRIGMQAARGLAAAHAQGLIHRDVKPGNILLENGVHRVKLTDFGLARAVDDVGMTQTGVVPGTPMYMSPEQASGDVVDQRSDLFSLGSVLYAMCTGRPPFRAATTLAVIRRVCDDVPRPIRDVNGDVPAWLVEIVEKLLEKNPANRFQTADEVASLLERHLAHLQQPDVVPQPERLSPALTLSAVSGRVRETTAGAIEKLKDPQYRAEVRTRAQQRLGQARDAAVDAADRVNKGYRQYAPKTGPVAWLLFVLWIVWWCIHLVYRILRKICRGLVRLYRRMTTPWLITAGAVVAAVAVLLALEGAGITNYTGHWGVQMGLRPRYQQATPWEAVLWPENEVDPLPLVMIDGQWWTLHEIEGLSVREVIQFARTAYGGAPWPHNGTVRSDPPMPRWQLHFEKYVVEILSRMGLPPGKTVMLSLSPPDASEPREMRLVRLSDGLRRHVEFAHGRGRRTGMLRNLQTLSTDRRRSRLWTVAFSPDGKTLATGSDDGTIRLRKAWSSNQPTMAIEAARERDEIHPPHVRSRPDHAIRRLAFSPDGSLLASAEFGYIVRLWDVETGREQAVLKGHTDKVNTAAFSPDGRRLASGDLDGFVRVWDVESAKEVAAWKAHANSVYSLDISKDGKQLATGGKNSIVRLWDVDAILTQKESPPRPFDLWDASEGRRLRQVESVRFSPDGETLAAGDWGGSVVLWDVATRRQRFDLNAHDAVYSLAWSKDGDLLAAGTDGGVKLWDPVTGAERDTVPSPDQRRVWEVAFSPDGSELAAALDDGRLILWNVGEPILNLAPPRRPEVEPPRSRGKWN